MKPEEIRGLAKATCCWLAYKHITGFGELLGEASLTIPISEYLSSSTNWSLDSEVQYKKICASNDLPDFWCDFAGTLNYGKGYRFILESKFLKEKAKNMSHRIAADLIRLSLPPNDGLKRYFLLAGQREHFPSGDTDFLFGHNLFGLKKGGGRYIRPREEIQNPDFAKAFPLYEKLLGQNQYLLDFAYIQYAADETIPVNDVHHFRVMVWSVGRSERTAEAGISS